MSTAIPYSDLMARGDSGAVGLDCSEGVTRKGEYQPCDRPAVGWRIDVEFDDTYPVCKRHHRAPFPATPSTETPNRRAPGDAGNAAAYVAMVRDEEEDE